MFLCALYMGCLRYVVYLNDTNSQATAGAITPPLCVARSFNVSDLIAIALRAKLWRSRWLPGVLQLTVVI